LSYTKRRKKKEEKKKKKKKIDKASLRRQCNYALVVEVRG
jgi:hypothetical protein